MKWFKHFSDASDDEFIEELEDKFGWEGYGRWWKLLEIIAKSMSKTGEPSAEHSWSKWQSFLKGKRNKLDSFLVHCQNKSKLELKQTGNILKITCPKLLDLKDNHTKNLQVSGKSLAPKNKEEEIEVEEERKKESKGASPPTKLIFVGKTIRLSQRDFDAWKSAYPAIPDLTAKLRALDDWFDLEPEKKKNWFPACSAALNKAHQDFLLKNPKRRDAPKSKVETLLPGGM